MLRKIMLGKGNHSKTIPPPSPSSPSSLPRPKKKSYPSFRPNRAKSAIWPRSTPHIVFASVPVSSCFLCAAQPRILRIPTRGVYSVYAPRCHWRVLRQHCVFTLSNQLLFNKRYCGANQISFDSALLQTVLIKFCFSSQTPNLPLMVQN